MRRLPQLLPLYRKLLKDYKQFKAAGGKIEFHNIAPVFNIDNSDRQSGGGQYFYQDIWALRILSQARPEVHVDVGSRYDGFVGQATVISKIIEVDIRPPSFRLENLVFIRGDVMQLPFKNESVSSLSSLHTLEHIGLGRYGDPIRPEGTIEAITELRRVLKKNGHLLISVPIGKERVEFNAQRIFNPVTILRLMKDFQLISFAAINDENQFVSPARPEDYIYAKYSCGLFELSKK
ncbi:MAG: DUF268 domain-containing protein [Methanobacteriota archaeon]|nr:MAG: DUF268 domain-containing protein [Euryarchaeota archaeon]